MLHKFKMALLRFAYSIKAAYYRMRGVCIGKNSFISGFPYIHICRGGQIRIGSNVTIHSKKKYNTLISEPVTMSIIERGGVLELQDGCGISGCKIVCSKHISIGKYTIIGPDTVLYDCKPHAYSPKNGWIGSHSGDGAPIIIGERCYIGMRCIILKGVTIGNNCVIAAGALINRDVPPGHFAQGNPAVYSPLPERLTVVESEE